MRPHQKETQKSPKLSEQSWFRQDCSKSWDKILLKICHSHTTPAKKSAITKTCPKRKNNKMAFDLGSSMAGPKTIPPCSFFPYIDFFLTKKRKSVQKNSFAQKFQKTSHPTPPKSIAISHLLFSIAIDLGGVGWDVLKQKKKNRLEPGNCFWFLFFASDFFFCFSFLFFLLFSSFPSLFLVFLLLQNLFKAKAKAKTFLWILRWRGEAVMPFLAWDTDTLT